MPKILTIEHAEGTRLKLAAVYVSVLEKVGEFEQVVFSHVIGLDPLIVVVSESELEWSRFDHSDIASAPFWSTQSGY